MSQTLAIILVAGAAWGFVNLVGSAIVGAFNAALFIRKWLYARSVQ